MKTGSPFFLVLFFISAHLGYGQNKETKTTDLPHIDVSGFAEKEIIPDEIYIDFVIRERYQGRTKITIPEQEERLKTSLTAMGIDLSNLFLSDANADFIKINWQKKEVITRKEYTLKVSKADEVALVFQEFDKLDIWGASIAKVNHSKIDSLKKAIRILAIKDAKDKADYLLTAIGEETGKPLMVIENPQGFTVEDVKRLPGRSISFIGYDEPRPVYEEEVPEIQFKKIKLTCSMSVRFLVK